MTLTLRHIGQLEAYLEEDHDGKRHTITAILPREEVEEMYRRLSLLADAVEVTAADFNGTTWDGSPFRPAPAPAWLMEMVERKYITVKPADRDYALWTVRTRYRDVVAEPGDYIIREPDGTLAVLIGHHPKEPNP